MPLTLFEKQIPEWEKPADSEFQIHGIHIWKVNLLDQAANVEKCYASLSEAEKDRVGRFRFETIRRRFTVAHGIAREVLGTYLNQPAADLEFANLPSGKPNLTGKSLINKPAIHFNLSHSEDLLLMAVSLEYELGIDVEWIKPGYEHAAVSKHFFAEAEVSWLQSITPYQQAEAFYRLWTCKEAVLKADGGGLRRKLEDVKIEFETKKKQAQCMLESLKLDSKKLERDTWAIQIFGPEPGYTAALAFNLDASAAVTPDIKFFRWIG